MRGESPLKNMDWRSIIRWLGTLLSIALLAWLVSRQDWRALVSAGRRVGYGGVALGLLFVMLRQLLNSVRWFVLLRVQPVQLSLWGAIRLTFAGLFASNFLPTTIGGDVIRLGGVLEASEDKVAGSASLVLDRLVGVISMLVFLPLGWPILVRIPGLGGASGMASFAAGRGIKGHLRSLRDRLSQVVAPWRDQPSAILLAFIINWLAVLCYFSAVWIVAAGIGISVSYWQVAGATALTYYLTLLPFSINGYGLRELGVVAVYTQLGAVTEQAAALALITRGLLWLVSLPGVLAIGPILAKTGDQSS